MKMSKRKRVICLVSAIVVACNSFLLYGNDTNIETLMGNTNQLAQTSPSAVYLMNTPLSTPSVIEIVKNPSFKDGLTNWKKASWDTSATPFELNTTEAHGDQSCAKISGGNKSIEQVIQGLEPSTAYTLKAWVKVGSAGGTIELGCEDNGSTKQKVTTSSKTYTQLTVTFATGVQTTAKIYAYVAGGTAEAYIDDFEVTAASTETVDGGTITINPVQQYQTFDGWGTSLCWFGNVIGGWSEANRKAVSDLLFDAEKGLGLNIVRYNIGGGDAPGHNHMRPGGMLPGFATGFDANGKLIYDWTADKNQINMLKDALERDVTITEAFSNSPPYFMTVSGCASGSVDKSSNNLKDEYYAAFADYLTEVVKHFRENEGITFNYLEPLNEPDTAYWGANGGQEGCHFNADKQEKIIQLTNESVKTKNLIGTVVSAMDESVLDTGLKNFNSFSQATKDSMEKWNIHTYGGSKRKESKNAAAVAGKDLWMSEVDLGSIKMYAPDSIIPGIDFAKYLTIDVRNIQPSAWCTWQAVENWPNMMPTRENSNWGMILANFEGDGAGNGELEAEDFRTTKKYYAMMQYSKFIKAGSVMIDSDNDKTLAFYNKANKQLVFVAINDDVTKNKKISFDLKGFNSLGTTAKVYRTSKSQDCEKTADITVGGGALIDELGTNTINTYVIDNVEYDNKIIKLNESTISRIDAENRFEYSGTWGYNPNQGVCTNDNVWSTSDTSKCTLYFTGNQAKIYGAKASGHGIAKISVDGGIPELVSLYSSTRIDGSLIYTTSVLASGKHVLVMEATGTKDLQATGNTITLDYAEVYSGDQAEVVQIKEIKEIQVTTIEGVAPQLPTAVDALYSDTTTKKLPVKWNEITVDKYSSVGTFEVVGTADGTELKAKAVVTVKAKGEDLVASKLILDYDMKNIEGNLVKDGKGTFNGTWVNKEKASFMGNEQAGAVSFVGGKTDSYIELPKGVLNGLTDVTISSLVNWKGQNEAEWIFGLGTNNNNATSKKYLFVTPRKNSGNKAARAGLGLTGWSNEAGADTASALSTNNWKLVTAVISGANQTITLYIDGVEVGSGSTKGYTLAGINNTNGLSGYVGKSFYSEDPYFGGMIADFEIYNSALTTDDIKGLKTAADDKALKLNQMIIQFAASQLDYSDILGKNTSKDEITTSLVLPSKGDVGTTITWQSNNPQIIANNGTVNRPEFEAGNQSVVLTATITDGKVSVNKEFTVTVIKKLADSEIVKLDTELLKVYNINDVRGNLTLQTNGKNGAAITWTSSNEKVITPTGEVTRPANGSNDVTVKLTAEIKFNNASMTKEFTAKVIQTPIEEDLLGYLFPYFIGEGTTQGEQMYFALSEGNDPLKWKQINSGNPVFISTLGEKGLRDPYIIKSPEGDKFYLIATDLKINGNGNWTAAQTTGSLSIMVWESSDLVNWTKQRMVQVSPEVAGCTWAPEAFYDKKTGEYVVFWASKIYSDLSKSGDPNQRIMYAKTRDFYTFTEAKEYYNPGYSVIDTTMIENDGKIYRFTKDERSYNATTSPNGKMVFEQVSDSIFGNFTMIKEGIGKGDIPVGEGPLVFKSNKENKWYLFIDHFDGGGYKPFVTTNLDSGNWTRVTGGYSLPSPAPRHGTVLPITATQYDALLKNLPVEVETSSIIAVTGVSLDKSTAVLNQEEKIQLTATATPDDATYQAVTWSSSDNAVATVDQTGKVTGVKAGKAIITVITEDGGYKSECVVTVAAPPSPSPSGNSSNSTSTLPAPAVPKPVVPAPVVTPPAPPTQPEQSKETVQVSISLTNGTTSKEGVIVQLSVKPYAQQGRTMAGIRDVATILQIENKDVVWNGKDRQVTIKTKGKEIKLVVNQKYAIVNGKKLALDVPVQIKDGRAVLPIAQIARLLDANVRFNEKTKEVIIEKVK